MRKLLLNTGYKLVRGRNGCCDNPFSPWTRPFANGQPSLPIRAPSGVLHQSQIAWKRPGLCFLSCLLFNLISLFS